MKKKNIIAMMLALLVAGGINADDTYLPFSNAKEENLTGFFGFRRESLATQPLSNIISEKDVIRVVFLANTTSAPNDIHMAKLSKLLKENPTVLSFWKQNTETGKKEWISESENVIPFFMVVLEKKDGNLVGFLFARGIVKVITKDGLGMIQRPT
jgi:hypothetical protein